MVVQIASQAVFPWTWLNDYEKKASKYQNRAGTAQAGRRPVSGCAKAQTRTGTFYAKILRYIYFGGLKYLS